MAQANFRSWLIVISFLGILALPLSNSIFGFLPDFQSSENRQLAPRPSLKLSLLDPFPRQFSTYYEDHFPFRFRLVNLYTRIHLDLLQESPIPDKAMIGLDGWYFLAGKEMQSYLGSNNPTALELDSIRLELEYRRDYLKQFGSEFYIAIVPAKNNVYVDKMPFWAKRSSQGGWGEQINHDLQVHSSVKVVDLYAPFQTLRDQYLLYYKLDHHWSPVGAFWASKIALQQMQLEMPQIELPALEDYAITPQVKHDGSITGMFGVEGNYTDTDFVLLPPGGFHAQSGVPVGYPPVYGFPYTDEFERVLNRPDTTLPRLLMITDSYGFHMFPFMAESFGHTTNIFDSW